MYTINFKDKFGYRVTEYFNDFMSAASYWERWADFPVYVGGSLCDTSSNETLWEF